MVPTKSHSWQVNEKGLSPGSWHWIYDLIRRSELGIVDSNSGFRNEP